MFLQRIIWLTLRGQGVKGSYEMVDVHPVYQSLAAFLALIHLTFRIFESSLCFLPLRALHTALRAGLTLS